MKQSFFFFVFYFIYNIFFLHFFSPKSGTLGQGGVQACMRCQVKGRACSEWKEIYSGKNYFKRRKPKKSEEGKSGEKEGREQKYYATVATRRKRKKKEWREYPTHALYWTPFTDPRSPLVNFILDFNIDFMHDVDGHVLSVGIGQLLAVGFEGETWKRIGTTLPPEFWQSCNAWMEHWRVWLPRDFARKPRSFEQLPKYKMRETHVAAVHLVPALCHVPDLWAPMDKGLYKNFMKLVAGVLLVGGFSCKPLPKVGHFLNFRNILSKNIL